MPFKNYIKSLFFARNTIKTHPYTQKVLIYQIEVVWGQQEVLEKNMTYAYFNARSGKRKRLEEEQRNMRN